MCVCVCVCVHACVCTRVCGGGQERRAWGAAEEGRGVCTTGGSVRVCEGECGWRI